jgi:hypothetical protein
MVTVDVLYDSAASALHDERIATRIRWRQHRLIAPDDLLCIRSGQGSRDVGKKGINSNIGQHCQSSKNSEKETAKARVKRAR